MEVLIAERVMQHYFPHHYDYWQTIRETLNCREDKQLLADAHKRVVASVYNPSFCPIAPYGFKSKYFRNMCLSLAYVAFPIDFVQVFDVIPELLGKPSFRIILNINPNPAVVQVLNLKMQIAAEKAEVKRLTAEHKATLKQLKIKKPDESVPLSE